MTAVDGNVAATGQFLGAFYLSDPQTNREQFYACLKVVQDLSPEELAQECGLETNSEVLTALTAFRRAALESTHDDLVWEFRRLFAGPGKKAAAPWSSVYLDREGVMFGKGCLELNEWMRRNGINVKDDSMPADHFGKELSLLSWLAEHNETLIDEFLQYYLLPWGYHYLDVVEKANPLPLYAGLAATTRLVLATAQQARGIEVKTPRFYR